MAQLLGLVPANAGGRIEGDGVGAAGAREPVRIEGVGQHGLALAKTGGIRVKSHLDRARRG